MARLARKWEELNRARFDASMAILTRYIHRAARDRETVDEANWQGKVAAAITGRSKGDRAARKAMGALATRLAESTTKSTDELIQLHSLSGRAAHKVLERVSDDYAHQAKTPEGASAALSGLFSGAVGGLAADLAAGGLTLGGGMIIGAVLGALGGTGIAKGFNLARGDDKSSVRWSAELLDRLTVTALLRYLAVAHFGRGRGEWAEGEHPDFWQSVVSEAVAERRGELAQLFKSSNQVTERENETPPELSSLLTRLGSTILAHLYPDATRA